MPYPPPLLPSIAASASKFLRLRSRCVRSFSAAVPPSAVREVLSILSRPDWQSRLESSDMTAKINGNLVHSVLLENSERMLDFFEWSKTRAALNSSSVLAVVLRNAELPDLMKSVVQQLVDTREPESQVLLDSIAGTYRVNCCSGGTNDAGSEIEMLISMYKKCGFLNEACSVFWWVSKLTDLQFPSLAFCNSFLSYLLRVNRVDMFWKVYESMSVAKVEPDVCTYTHLISAHCIVGDFHAAEKSLLDIEKNGFIPDVFSYKALMDGYCKAGHVEAVFGIEDEMTCRGIEPTTATYNVLLDGLYRNQCMSGYDKYEILGAEALFEEMIESSSTEDTYPNIDTYHTMMELYFVVSLPTEALRIKDEMTARGITMTTRTYNILLDRLPYYDCVICCSSDVVFREMVGSENAHPDNQTYSAVLLGCLKSGNTALACQVLNEMRSRNSLPTCLTYDMVIQVLCMYGELQQAESLLKRMISSGLRPNVHTIRCLDCFRNGNVESLCEEMISSGLWPNVDMNIYLHRYRNGNANISLDRYRSIIFNLIYCKKMKEARAYMDEVSEKMGLFPEEGNMQKADWHFKHILSSSSRDYFRDDIYEYLIDEYCKEGNAAGAFSLFNISSGLGPVRRLCGETKSVASAATLIQGLANYGKVEEAMKLFSEFKGKHLFPYGLQINGGIYTSLMAGFFKLNKTEIALQLFDEMFEPCFPYSLYWRRNTESNLVAIECLCKLGDIERASKLLLYVRGEGYCSSKSGVPMEAFRLLHKMFKEDTYICSNIIDCCLKQGKVEEAFSLAYEMVDLWRSSVCEIRSDEKSGFGRIYWRGQLMSMRFWGKDDYYPIREMFQSGNTSDSDTGVNGARGPANPRVPPHLSPADRHPVGYGAGMGW